MKTYTQRHMERAKQFCQRLINQEFAFKSDTPVTYYYNALVQNFPMLTPDEKHQIAKEAVVVMKVELSEKQRFQLDELWFIYGNNGPKHARRDHRFIQCILEHGEYYKEFFKPSKELVKKVDEILSE